MRRVIGINIRRTFREAVIWENGLIRHEGRADMTRTALKGFAPQLLETDEAVIEGDADQRGVQWTARPRNGNCMAVSRVLSPHVARLAIANPLQGCHRCAIGPIAHVHGKTDKVDAATLASLHAAGCLPEIWTPDAAPERLRGLVARRCQVVRHLTRIRNEVHAILHAHLIPKCPHADLFNRRGRDWLARQPVPDDEKAAIARHVRELDRLGGELAALDRDIAQDAPEDEAIRRRLTITGVNLAVAAGLMAVIGSIGRFSSPRKLASYSGLNPRLRQSGLGAAPHGRREGSGLLHPHPGAARPPDRRCGGRTQTRRTVLAHGDEWPRLPPGPPEPGGAKGPRHGTGFRAAAEDGQQARSRRRLQHQGNAPPGNGNRREGAGELRALRCCQARQATLGNRACGRPGSAGTEGAAR
ncbi:transposase [Mangrovicoccus ximenensis]|uniref:transposase n=1 Tax=Mangrovicoccus ximenensis TaxID=1911570 RepID=UPI00191C22E4|nr:transposase [Mangrovicoccus ximenensis]